MLSKPSELFPPPTNLYIPGMGTYMYLVISLYENPLEGLPDTIPLPLYLQYVELDSQLLCNTMGHPSWPKSTIITLQQCKVAFTVFGF